MVELQWFFARDTVQSGPVTTAQLRLLAQAGQLAPEDLVWREGMDDWAPAARVKGLFPEPRPPAEPVPPAPPEPPPISETLPEGIDDFLTGSGPPEPRGQAAEPAAAETRVSLGNILLALQMGLWGLCVLMVLLGGVGLLVALLRGDDPSQRGAAGMVLAALFLGAYVMARATEKLSHLVLDPRRRQAETPPVGPESSAGDKK
jgi:hypothetical protein